MPSSVFWGMQHLNNNLICAVDIATSGRTKEIVQICVLPLDQNLKPHPELILFDMKMKPYDTDIHYDTCDLTKAEMAQILVKGTSRDQVALLFEEWYSQMQMKENKRIIPIAHGWPRMREMIKDWLTEEVFFEIFSDDYRDTLTTTHYINDRDASRNEPVTFSKQFLPWVAKQLHVSRATQGGNCSENCLTTAEIYRKQLLL